MIPVFWLLGVKEILLSHLGPDLLKCNSIKAPMGGKNSAFDLLTMRKLKNTDAARPFP